MTPKPERERRARELARKIAIELARERVEDSLVELVKHVSDHSSGRLKKITYGELAERIGYLDRDETAHAHGMGDVLREMGHLLDDLSAEWEGGPIPYIQSLVVNQKDRLPGNGIDEFWPGYKYLNKQEKIDRVQKEYRRILKFGSRWNDVLSSFDLAL